MKVTILTIAATLLVAGSVVLASNMTQKQDTCTKSSDCVCCPCTPDCQPGDEWCTCPEGCTR